MVRRRTFGQTTRLEFLQVYILLLVQMNMRCFLLQKWVSTIKRENLNLTLTIEIKLNRSMSVFTIKYLHDFNAKMHQFHQYYLRKGHRLRRKLELSQTGKEIHPSNNSLFTPVQPNRNSNLKILFVQSGHSHQHGKETNRKGLQNCDISLVEEKKGLRSSGIWRVHYGSTQNLWNQIEKDTQIAESCSEFSKDRKLFQ